MTQQTKTVSFRSAALAGAVLTLALGGCSIGPSARMVPEQTAQVQLRATSVNQPLAAKPVEGVIRFAQMQDGGVRVTGEVRNLKPNSQHGFHIHEFGNCSAPDGMSAGGHFNPTNAQHSLPGQGHVGDLPQLVSGATGTATVQYVARNMQLAGANGVIGKSVIVHANADDPNAQPAGNSGARLACGVIQAGN